MASGTVVEYELAGDARSARDTAAGVGDAEGGGGAAQTPERTRLTGRRACALALTLALAVAAGATAAVLLTRRAGGAAEAAGSDAGLGATVAPAAVTAAPAGGALPPVPVGPPRVYGVTVVRATPHDAAAFLQGFEYDGVGKQFFESTGLRGGRSSLRRVEIETGKVLQQVGLPDASEFGEGMTLLGEDRIAMLTWQKGKGYVFDRATFDVVSTWAYPGEGWGLATDRVKDEVYMSDGTPQLRVLDPATLAEKRRVNVTNEGVPAYELNEIEWVCGELWANVWQSNDILRIDPASGAVRSVVRVKGLPRPDDVVTPPNVLNGIAFDRDTLRIWITGKLWPMVYEVTVDDDSIAAMCVN